MLRSIVTSVFAILALLVPLASVATTTDAEPRIFVDNGVPGSYVSISSSAGGGFGDKKGKITLRPDQGRGKGKVKILSWSDSRITLRIKKAKPGASTFTIKPKKGEPCDVPFTIDEPHLGSQFSTTGGVGPMNAPRGSYASVVVYGDGKKPKVTVGGIKVRLKNAQPFAEVNSEVSTSNFEWVFRVPDKLDDGEHEIVARTRNGTVTSEPGKGLFVQGDDARLGTEFVEVTVTEVDGSGKLVPETARTFRFERDEVKTEQLFYSGRRAVCGGKFDGSKITMEFGFELWTQMPVPAHFFYPAFTGAWFRFTEQPRRDKTWWSSENMGADTMYESFVTKIGGGQVSGTFEGRVRRFSGTLAPRDLHMEGTFLVDCFPRLR